MKPTQEKVTIDGTYKGIWNENPLISFQEVTIVKEMGQGEKLHVMTRTHTERRTHVHTQRHSTMTRYYWNLAPIRPSFCVFLFSLLLRVRSLTCNRSDRQRKREEYFVTRQSTLQDYKLGNGRWPGDDDETSGIQKFCWRFFFWSMASWIGWRLAW